VNKSKTYDCFCYYNEDMLLDLRLRTLWDVVDVFVIVESTYTTSGRNKPLNFDPLRFKRFEAKIRYVSIDECPGGTLDPWANERYQRNQIKRGLYDAAPRDRILVSDLDEIPEPAAIHSYSGDKLRGDFQQRYYSYYLNNLLVEPERERVWVGSKITLYKHFVNFFDESAESVRSFKSRGLLRSLHRTWFKITAVQVIQNGGWHFTWIASTDGILDKMNATAHQENNRGEWRTRDYIESTIAAGRDLVRKDRRYRVTSIDDTFPEVLRAEMTTYANFILPVPAQQQDA